VVWHAIGREQPVRGKQALIARFTEDPGWQISVDLHDVVANDEHVVAMGNATATRDGETLEYRVAEIYHVRDGKVTERWAFSDDTARIAAFFG
jgi:uncharacterized protein